MSFQDITHPDDVAGDLALDERLLRGEVDRYELSKRYLRKGGDVLDTLVHVSMGPTRTGRRGTSSRRCSTSRRSAGPSARCARARSAPRQDALPRHVPVGIFETDLAGRYTSVNERWCQLTGYTGAEVVGQPWDLVLHPDDRERGHRRVGRGRAAGPRVRAGVPLPHRRRPHRRGSTAPPWRCATTRAGSWATSAPCSTSPSASRPRRSCSSTTAWPPWARWPPGSRTRSTTRWPTSRPTSTSSSRRCVRSPRSSPPTACGTSRSSPARGARGPRRCGASCGRSRPSRAPTRSGACASTCTACSTSQ